MSSDPSRHTPTLLKPYHHDPIPQLQPRSGSSILRQKHQSSNLAFSSSPLRAAALPSSSLPQTFIAPNSVIPQLSAATNEILARVNSSNVKGTAPGWEAAREQVLSQMVTSHNMPTPAPSTFGRKRGRGTKGASPAARGTIRVETRDIKLGGELGPATPGHASSRGARGRGGGRGRGRGAGRGGKRKRPGSEDDNVR